MEWLLGRLEIGGQDFCFHKNDPLINHYINVHVSDALGKKLCFFTVVAMVTYGCYYGVVVRLIANLANIKGFSNFTIPLIGLVII